MVALNFPINEAQITGLFVESVLFGMHLITYGYCLRALTTISSRYRSPTSSTSSPSYSISGGSGTRWREWRDINWAMLAVSSFLLGNAAFDVFLGFAHNLKAFMFYNGSGSADFGGISYWINVSKSLTVVIQTMVGDAMLIYRCWIIHESSFLVVAFPMLLWLGCFASTIWVITLEATLHSNVLVSTKQLLPAGTTFWALTISLNIITTSLLIYRIWSVDRSNRRYSGGAALRRNTLINSRSPTAQNASNGNTANSNNFTNYNAYNITQSQSRSHSVLRRVMRIIVESGLLYSVTAFITFVTFVTGSNGVYVITDAEIQIVGIAFNLIIVRAANLATLAAEGSTMGRSTRDVPLEIVRPTTTTDGMRTMDYTNTQLESKMDEESRVGVMGGMQVHVLTTQYSVDNFSKTERSDVDGDGEDTSVKFRSDVAGDDRSLSR